MTSRSSAPRTNDAASAQDRPVRGGPTPRQWLEGARLRTLPLAFSPIIAGSAAAAAQGSFHAGRALLALLVAVLLQVGVNYANDYSDGIKGTDDVRVGPLRLTASGIASPRQVKAAALGSFAAAALVGLALVLWTQQWWFLGVGAVSVLAAWGYTGGKNPYGYRGLGEIFVFIFFGLVATVGTEMIQAGRASLAGWLAAAALGLLACAVLMANNIRDIPTDAQVGKNTLAVRLGDRGARRGFLAMVVVPFLLMLPLVPARPAVLLVVLAAAGLVRPVRVVLSGAGGPALVPVLKLTGLASVAFAALFALGLLVGG